MNDYKECGCDSSCGCKEKLPGIEKLVYKGNAVHNAQKSWQKI